MFTKQQALEDAKMGDNVWSIYVYRNWHNYYQQRVKMNDPLARKMKQLMSDRDRVKKIQSETSYRPS